MSSNPAAYPQPQEDDDNRAFLAAWRQGRLLIQVCADCGRHFFYPRPLCPHCWSADLRSKDAAGQGEVVSFSLIHRPNHPSFSDEVPIALAEVRLAEGVLLLARIVGVDPAALRSGMAVRLVPRSEAARYPLPTFTAG
ncbi:MAG: Zn-ribbon domain-containing OB-fold protein [Alphaproteobacteria bacterium]